MNASTRSAQKRRQAGHLAMCLAAVFLNHSKADAAFDKSNTALPSKSVFLSAPPENNMALSVVPYGQEALQFSARFSSETLRAISGVQWRIKSTSGALMFDGKAAMATALLPAGNYMVEANYGAVRLMEPFSLQAGTKLEMDFVLNAGLLRILPQPNNGCRNLVYALNGIERGTLVASSYTAGEMIGLSAGTYRIESRWENNVVTVNYVTIKAGIMSAVTVQLK
jgi:hypothetical protein